MAGPPHPRMAEGVTYADLRFVRTPPAKSQEKEASEGELTYENVRGPGALEEKALRSSKDTKESARRTWFAALAVLGTCLFLLATTIGLGVRYGQVSQQFHQESQGHAAQSSLLAQRIEAMKHSLDLLAQRIEATEQSLAHSQQQLQEAERDLGATQVALEESWRAGNRTQQRLEEEVRRGNSSLAVMKQEKEEAERNLEQARSCQQMGCCPSGWKLFRWKCLWIASSAEKKNWEDSKLDCQDKSSQLLTLKPWNARELWNAAIARNDESTSQSKEYWIGLAKWSSYKKVWFYVDGCPWEETTRFGTCEKDGRCVQMSQGVLKTCNCWSNYRYICEKAASPVEPAHTLGQ
ncbi:B-cell differentiation antigen CD72-like [Rhineura floridana]|uniref:B-cell differentiation antigen CD72-like n=1 Tax=Rhineura floridana TaxID=261503 RepID=UPI002AC836D6|nr:B-cell differentiation antigen CD72-like [Rhineura floridana]XP_061468724.1 B-cell differentiation antigen CD72-like [Rhineura floridana]